jgi:hypothetical protein
VNNTRDGDFIVVVSVGCVNLRMEFGHGGREKKKKKKKE